jgi:hypothetical protein
MPRRSIASQEKVSKHGHRSSTRRSRQAAPYIGLVFGLLFILMGLTGTAISWRDELDQWLNPDLLQASSATRIPVGAATVESVTGKLMADPQYGKPNLLMLPVDQHDVFIAYYPIKGERPARDVSGR